MVRKKEIIDKSFKVKNLKRYSIKRTISFNIVKKIIRGKRLIKKESIKLLKFLQYLRLHARKNVKEEKR